MVADSRLQELDTFQNLSNSVGNAYQTICRICKQARKYHNDNTCLDSEALTYAISGKVPKQPYSNVSSEYNKMDRVLSLVSDDDVIQSVRQSVKYSTKESINYVYLDTLDTYKQSRVRILVNMIMLQ